MDQEYPFGVRWIIIVNSLTAIGLIVLGIMCVVIYVPNFFQAAKDAGENPSELFLVLSSGVAALLGLIPAGLVILLNRQIKNLNSKARKWQILVSIFGLSLYVPFGTFLHLVTLGFVLFGKKTKAAFN